MGRFRSIQVPMVEAGDLFSMWLNLIIIRVMMVFANKKPSFHAN